ncbi:hypothetical protein QWY31_03005 [Cytophagales bacterium LB-30]|uniref:TFIIB-type zinc ribbon-containing protein n=1 Tax=Shiella aurantiaca TaxID=3058365 RepID=A0ABT8F370_9BACT|nr:hypothetical protein [Shiella aurantiaca]MDN4164451.1 hypothetical protein [Shiella aurantiaca]
MKISHKGAFICSECGTILNEEYNFKHKELSNKEFESIISNAGKDRSDLIKLISLIIFVLEGNSILIKTKNGQNNTGVFSTSMAEKFLNEIKDGFRIGKLLNIADWVNNISNLRLGSCPHEPLK